jgi:uncharacterized protein YerC
MRASQKKINQTLDVRLRRTFIQLISDLKNPKEIDSFFKDFLTPAEYEMFTKRLAICYWLKKGRTYANIKENLKVSSATIATAQEIMEKEGIKLALKKIEAEEWAGKWEKKINKFLINKR